MGTKPIPDTLYAYRLFTVGGAFNVCSETSNSDNMWALIKKARSPKANDLKLWSLLQNGTYERFYLDAEKVVGMADKTANVPVQKPNVAKQRKARPNATASSAIARKTHPSRVTIGQTAKKSAGRKR